MNVTRLNFILLVALVACALSIVTSQNQARELYSDLQKEQAATRQLGIEWGKLQLEQSTWAQHARIEKIATTQLMMRVPSPAQTRVIVLPALSRGTQP